jgi:hypothetical protein
MRQSHSLAVALALLLLPALASGAEVLGWADKGASFVVQRDEGNGGAGGTPAGTVNALVFDAASGEAQKFHLKDYVNDEDKVDAKDSAAFESWRKAHPVTPAKLAKVSPDGKASLELTTKTGSVEAFDKDGFPYTGESIECPNDEGAHMGGCGVKPGIFNGFVNAGGKKRLAASFQIASKGGRVATYFSPDASKVVWVLDGAPENPFSGEPGPFIVVVSGGKVSLEVLADETLLKEVAPRAAAALRKAGFFPARIGKAVKAREKSVVYAAKGSEAAAKSVAAAVQGGATVEPLSWKSDCELVVAVGASAK